MVQSHSDFLSLNSSSVNLYYSIFTPENKVPKGTILVIHGMQEYSDRYIDFAKFFVEHGFAVLIYDQLGHGKSVKEKIDLGFFQIESPDKKLVDDAAMMNEFLSNSFPEVPHFVLGHSMGSFVARCLLNRDVTKFDGAVIVGTGGKLAGINLLIAYFSLMNKLNPRGITKFNSLFNFMNNIKFRKENLKSSVNWLSLNVKNREDYDNDELCGLPFTNNGFYTLFSIYKKATNKSWASNIPKNFPMSFVSGQNDTIGNFSKGVTQTVENLKTEEFNDITLMVYKDMRHEILREDIREEVFSEINNWLIKQL